MYMRVEKYERQPYKLVVNKLDAEALGLKHGQIVHTNYIKIVRGNDEDDNRSE